VASICEVVERFFLGDLDGPALSFSWIPVDMGQRSPFSRAVMEGMRAIPGGFVASYSALATAAGAPRAARGAGSVVGANPVALVVPCHRVVGTGGRLTGYGGTLPLKVVMLALEAQMTRRPGEPIPL
jgi:O-6-methylguanine DNA methyltransferase